MSEDGSERSTAPTRGGRLRTSAEKSGASRPGAAESQAQITIRVGANIRDARRATGLSLAAVGDRTGVSVATLSRIENGRQGVEATMLILLARIHGVSPASLLGTTEPARGAPALIAALARAPHAERRRVARAAAELSLVNATDGDVVDEVVEHLAAAAATLNVLKRKVKKRGRSASHPQKRA